MKPNATDIYAIDEDGALNRFDDSEKGKKQLDSLHQLLKNSSYVQRTEDFPAPVLIVYYLSIELAR